MSALRIMLLPIALAASGIAQAQDHSQHQSHVQQQQSQPSSADTVNAHPLHGAEATQQDAGAYHPPALTDADRAAAFPDLGGHDMGNHMDDDPFVWMVLVDRLEWQKSDDARTLAWDTKAWFGHDDNRLWLRSEGEREHDRTENADIEALWGKPVSPWWDVLFGVRHDFEPGPSQTWAAIGVQGMAPYKFEVEATAYLGEHGQTAAQLEVEYDLLLTNRLILQPRIEATLHGRDDEARGIGSGLSEADAGLRLRYEIRREFAPYVGVEWSRRFGTTADFARAAGDGIEDTRFVAGVRIWF
ncbi:copper resistance protein B [Lysobacter fragariae]